MSRTATLLLLVLMPVAVEAGDTLHVYHTNDTQGRLQRDFDEGDEAPVGGMARIVQLLRDLRQRHDVAPLFVDAGDALGAAALSEFDGGRLMVELLSEAGLDVALAGNHEFDYGIDTLRMRARQAGFAFVGSNIQVDDGSPLRDWVVAERDGRRIGVLGLIDPALARVINKQRNPGLVFQHPQATLDHVVPALQDSVDLIIALVHMSVADAMDLAARNPAVTLWIVGPGTSPVPPHDVQLLSGAHVITTPGDGLYLGHIEICWPDKGMPRGTDLSARLLPIVAQLPVDEHVLVRVTEQRRAFEESRRESLARVVEPIDDAMVLVADILRTRAHAEVCVVNRGTLREHTLAGQLTLADVDRLVRYEDNVVVVELTGNELKTLAARSADRQQHGQQLVFSGFDPKAGRIDGRALHGTEVYRVVTTSFLAAGGDDYLKNTRSSDPGASLMTLRNVLVEHLRAHATVGPGTGIAAGTGRTWKSQTKWSGSLSRTGVSTEARRYSGVSFLSGSDAMTWNSIVDSRWTRESVTGTLAMTLRSTFGQVRENDAFRESADRLQMESIYSWERFRPAPFLSADVNSVWTVPAGEKRPVTLRASAGVQRSFASTGKIRMGLGLERDVASGGNEVGVELVPDYRRRFGRDNSFRTSLKVFAGATETRKISAQQYNNLLVNLKGNLYITVDANFFFHRDDVVGDAGLKSEVQIGFGYTVRGKWI